MDLLETSMGSVAMGGQRIDISYVSVSADLKLEDSDMNP